MVAPDWIRSLAAMMITWDIVRGILNCENSDLLDPAAECGKRVGGMSFNDFMHNFSVDKLVKKIMNNGIHGIVLNVCKKFAITDRPSHAWKHAILMRDTIYREIDMATVDMVNFNGGHIESLLEVDRILSEKDPTLLPEAMGFFLYGVGETLVYYGNADLIDCWHKIVRRREPSFFD
ncbi:MAG: hypothetical protein Harvfovirus38_9 [Harvfovirus sp.]|uniref:Uncharacterized protein n=1 Tax=Harvfovirus sp. TaxID=2487768 RepID=A0A3G5A2T8_9VIRU|nr:MAG: hypothetical protein Harvfovirus38_9 [Harvfovirus sp.]